MIAVPVVATERASAKFVFTHFNTDNSAGIHSHLYIFVLGLLMSQYYRWADSTTGACASPATGGRHSPPGSPDGILLALLSSNPPRISIQCPVSVHSLFLLAARDK